MRGEGAFGRDSRGARIVSLALQQGVGIAVHRIHPVVAGIPARTAVARPRGARCAGRQRSDNKPAAIDFEHFELLSGKAIYPNHGPPRNGVGARRRSSRDRRKNVRFRFDAICCKDVHGWRPTANAPFQSNKST